MDWTRAIERNTEALEAVLASLLSLFALAGGATRISRPLHRAVLRVLQPAEAAVRRLIVIAARGLAEKPAPSRSAPSRFMPARSIVRAGRRAPSFRLFDRRKRCSFEARSTGKRLIPRIHVFASDPRVVALWRAPEPPPAPPPVPDDGLVDARRVERRLEALRLALADVPRQARRLVRLRARRATNPLLSWKSPLRPGPPPGHRRTPIHDADFVLKECHALARDALTADTS